MGLLSMIILFILVVISLFNSHLQKLHLKEAKNHSWGVVPVIQERGWSGVTYGKGRFVAVGRTGSIISSVDASDWNTCYSDNKMHFNSIIFANHQFVAVGNDGVVMGSLDGCAWSLSESPTKVDLHSIAFGNDHYVAISYDRIYTSPDLKEWKVVDDIILGYNIRKVRFADGKFIVVGDQTVGYWSKDGASWTEFTSDPKANHSSLRDIVYVDGKYFAMGITGDIGSGGIIYEGSRDLKEWKRVVWYEDMSHAIHYHNNEFIVVGTQSILTSKDGQKWEMYHSNSSLRDVAFGNGQYVAVGKHVLLGK
jgi:photosystem II stability/assembly factor-like uncharacterized protein